MKKTSRRSFGKQLAGALAAAPVAALALNSSGQGKQRSKAQPDFFKEHDTPPPVLFMQGSFIVEIAEVDFDEDDVHDGNRRKYRRHPKQKTKVHVAHVKVIDGSGEMLYRYDNDMDNPRDIRIAVTTEAGIADIRKVGNNFELDIPDTKRFKKATGNDMPLGNTRHARYRYKDRANDMPHNMTGVKITKGASMVLFDLNDFNDLKSNGEELRIMVWLEET